MQPSQFIAALVIIAVAIGLLLARFGPAGGEAVDSEPGASADGASADGAAVPEAESEPAGAPTGGLIGGEQASTATEIVVTPDAPPILADKPALTKLDGWLQTDATSLDDFAGQVRIVEFWTFGCFNCKNRLPFTQDIYARWKPEGLEIVGVHSPEFDYERDPSAVAAAAVDLGVTWPVALDTDRTNFRAWQGSRRFWPRTYVLDQNGRVRYDHIGEGDYDGLEQVVAYLIENGP